MKVTLGKKMTWPVLLIWSSQKFEFMTIFMFLRAGNPFWHYYWATMLGWPRKSRSTSGTGGTWRYWWIFEIFLLFMFSRVRNPFLIFLLSYYVSVTSKIQVNFRYRGYLKILLIVIYLFYFIFSLCLIDFWNFLTIYVFEIGKSISDIAT